MASPCPTSITISSPSPAGDPRNASNNAPTRTMPTRSVRGGRRRGFGQRTHSIARTSIAPTLTRGPRSRGSAAPGRLAHACATAATWLKANPAKASTTRPTPSGADNSPARPLARPSDTRGMATRLLTTPTDGSWANVPAVSGSVAACAVTHTAIGAASARRGRGRSVSHHPRASGPKAMIPSTAAADIINPSENAATGFATRITATARASAESESVLRPRIGAICAAATSPSALSAEGCSPLTTTNPAHAARTNPADSTLGTLAAPTIAAANAATTARWVPETAMMCARPAARASDSSCVPSMARRSPRSMPHRRAPPSPFTFPISSAAHALNLPATPCTPGSQPTSRTSAADTAASTPRRLSSRAHSSFSGRAVARTLTRRPSSSSFESSVKTRTTPPGNAPESSNVLPYAPCVGSDEILPSSTAVPMPWSPAVAASTEIHVSMPNHVPPRSTAAITATLRGQPSMSAHVTARAIAIQHSSQASHRALDVALTPSPSRSPIQSADESHNATGSVGRTSALSLVIEP